MSFREMINQKQHVATIATGVIILLAVVLIIWQLMPVAPPKPPTKAYYSIDDGATWFEDDIEKVSPFKKDGKDAFRAHVYKCGKEKEFCGWLEAFTPQAKKILDDFYNNPANKGKYPDKRYELEETSKLVKKPGQKWIPLRSTAADQVTLVTCPGSGDIAIEVYPD